MSPPKVQEKKTRGGRTQYVPLNRHQSDWTEDTLRMDIWGHPNGPGIILHLFLSLVYHLEIFSERSLHPVDFL